ncbi:benzoylformate decarboxylase [Effusibacillus dendaii]|uniref:Benzoylformate decarboxylase n=2 Tax=Effusibacillus dendaii TaxID=2743772 RepID=A0A7I8DCU1_9BACL|nr:benzoylformate decarboxylase [Effusibacillus dendaii]
MPQFRILYIEKSDEMGVDRMLGRDVFLSALREYGVKYLFGNPGTTELPVMDGLVDYPDIEYILALHEDIAVGMAAGYAQATGKPGVVNLHVAPGLAHGLGNIYDAYKAGVPLIITAGQHESRLAIQEPALWGDLVSMVKPYTKWCWEVQKVEELPIALQRAFKVAMTEPRGPVFLSLPGDVMMQEVDAKPLPLTTIRQRNTPAREDLELAGELLLKANNPVFLIGDRVGRMNAVEETVRLAELTGAKVYGEHQSSGYNFPYRHPQHLGRCLPNGPFIRTILADADVVLMLGISSQAPLLYFAEPLVGETAKVIHIDCSEWELAKNMHVDCAILADIKSTIAALNRFLDGKISTQTEVAAAIGQRRHAIEQLKQERFRQLQKEAADTKDQVPLSPAFVMEQLNRFLDDRTFVVDESVTTGRYVHSYLDIRRPNSLISLKGGGLGYGMPAALGAQLARPDERVVAIIGDGSALYYIQSLWNAAKYQLPVVFLIVNNTSYMILKGGLQRMNGSAAQKGVYPGMDLVGPEVDLTACARSFGVEAIRAEKPEELQHALQHAFSERRPILIDCVIDRTVKVFLQ